MKSESTVLLSSAYLPSIEYMALILKHENVIIEKDESYLKQTYRNRCSILSANGILNLSIPVTKPDGNNTKTKRITILNTEAWYINHWRAMYSAYSGSPFFLYYKDDLESFFAGSHNNLLDYNTGLTNELLSLIGIKSNITYSLSFTQPNSVLNDYRFSLSPKIMNNSNNFDSYTQVFSNKFNFMPNLSIIDLLFNMGPDTLEYLMAINDNTK
ncbi:MAG: WbqC family protein [Bacteroidota bacterium]